MEDSEWYPECVKYYSTLDVKDRIVVDIGCDFGTSPMFFIGQGAKFVWGFSLDDRYFQHNKYAHIKGVEYYPSTGLHVYNINENEFHEFAKVMKEYDGKINLFFDEIQKNEKVLKCDAEGWEWNMSIDFIDGFLDWVIALHYPIKNQSLYEWIKQNGEFVGSPSNLVKDSEEFAIFKKRGVNDA